MQMHPPVSRPRRNGFTIIELMIVITVIAILIGLLIPAIGIIQRRSQEADTRSVMANVEAAIGKYHALNATYPEGTVTPVPGGDTYEIKTAIDSTGVTSDHVKDNAKALYHHIASLASDVFGRGSDDVHDEMIIDRWKEPIFYRPFVVYPYEGLPSDVPLAHSDDPPRPDSYQLWSFGINKKNDHGVRGSNADDLNNWE